MCVMCDGASLDECRFNIHAIIDRCGWFIQYVEVEPLTRAWAYTIGLSAGFDHPELVITGVRPETAARVLNGIGEMVRDGRHFVPGNLLVDPAGRCAEMSEVHPHHFERSVFTAWVDYYDCLGPPYPDPKALEVVLPGRKARLASPRSPTG